MTRIPNKGGSGLLGLAAPGREDLPHWALKGPSLSAVVISELLKKGWVFSRAAASL